MVKELEKILSTFRSNGGNIITLLQETQEVFGYVPKEAIAFFSDELRIPSSRFYGVATFYSQFRLKPVGRHRVTACCGTACHVKGAERILNGLKRELRLDDDSDTTEDNEFTVEKVACLGFCSFAPVVLVDEAVRGKTNTEKIVKEIKAMRKKK